MNALETLETRRLLSAGLVADVAGIYPTDSVNVNGVSYFAADDGVYGKELWMTGAGPEDTELVRDIVAGSAGSSPIAFSVVNGRVVFFVKTGDDIALWTTDGTESGTVKLSDIGEILYFAPWTRVISADDQQRMLFMSARNVTEQDSISELWSTDGTADGTTLVRQFDGSMDPNLNFQQSIKHRHYFLIGTEQRAVFAIGENLWSSDGTDAGTVQIASNGPFYSLTEFKGSVVYGTSDFNGSPQLWITDGTGSSTRKLADLTPQSHVDGYFTVSGDKLYLLMGGSEGNDTKKWLWVTDGTEAGTHFIRKFDDASGLGQLGAVPGDKVVFSYRLPSDQAGATSELWISDGTEAGTHLLLPILNDGRDYGVAYFRSVGGVTFFAKFGQWEDRDGGWWQLCRTDGTVEGTFRVSQFAEVQTGVHGVLEFGDVDGKLTIEHVWADGTGTILETFVFDPANLSGDGRAASAKVTLADRVLRAFGTDGDDNIRVYQVEDNPDRFVVNLNGVKRSFAFADVRKLIVYGYAGNDAIAINEVNGLVKLRSLIKGGSGNDSLYGGASRDSVYGEAGDDFIHTSRSHDLILGGAGNDTLLGSTGADTLNGDDGADSLVGGRDEDLVSGGSDDDDDSIDGGAGADVLFGNAVFEIFYNGQPGEDPEGWDEILLG